MSLDAYAGEHPNAELVRRAFHAFESGDETTARDVFAADLVWRVGGHGPASGTTIGLDGVLANFAKIMEWTAGTYRAEPQDFLGSDDHAIAITRASGTRPDGRTLDVVQAVIFRVDGGRLARCEHIAYDEDAWTAFFA